MRLRLRRDVLARGSTRAAVACLRPARLRLLPPLCGLAPAEAVPRSIEVGPLLPLHTVRSELASLRRVAAKR